MHVGIGSDPTLLSPRQHLFDLDRDFPRGRGYLDNLAHWPNLEPLRYLDVHLPQRQIDSRLSRYVRAGVAVDRFSERHTQLRLGEMEEVHAVVLEPGWVEDPMAINRRQIFPPFAVDVELDGHRLAPFALYHP